MIDTKKAIRFYDDRSKGDTIIMTEIVFEDGKVCTCKVDDEYVLFDIETGKVLSSNYEFYYAENYRPDVIIKIATITDERRTFDYLDLTHMKFSNKEDFSDGFVVRAIAVTMNDGVITEISQFLDLPENIETEIKYVKLTLFNDQYKKEQTKEYHIKMARNVGVEMVGGKATAVISHNYILHNRDDYAYKYYMGFTEYEKGYFIDGGRVPKFYMSYRTKLNKVNNTLDDNGLKSKLQKLKNYSTVDEETPMRYVGKTRAFFTLDTSEIRLNLIPGITTQNVDDSLFEPLEEFLDKQGIKYKRGTWLKDDIEFADPADVKIVEEIYNFMLSVGYVLDTYKQDENYRFMTNEKPDISEYMIYVGWQDLEEQYCGEFGTEEDEREYFQDEFSFNIYTSHETPVVYDQSVGWIDDRTEWLLKHLNDEEDIYISFGAAENLHVITLSNVSKYNIKEKAREVLKKIWSAVKDAEYFEWYDDNEDDSEVDWDAVIDEEIDEEEQYGYISIEDASFEIQDENEMDDLEPGQLSIFIHDVNGSDDVRGVKHQDWDKYWENIMENVFVSDKFANKQEAINWLNNIGLY